MCESSARNTKVNKEKYRSNQDKARCHSVLSEFWTIQTFSHHLDQLDPHQHHVFQRGRGR